VRVPNRQKGNTFKDLYCELISVGLAGGNGVTVAKSRFHLKPLRRAKRVLGQHRTTSQLRSQTPTNSGKLDAHEGTPRPDHYPLEGQMTAAAVPASPVPVLAERGGTQIKAPKAVLLVDTRGQNPLDC
jgi:hypothetical protein